MIRTIHGSMVGAHPEASGLGPVGTQRLDDVIMEDMSTWFVAEAGEWRLNRGAFTCYGDVAADDDVGVHLGFPHIPSLSGFYVEAGNPAATTTTTTTTITATTRA